MQIDKTKQLASYNGQKIHEVPTDETGLYVEDSLRPGTLLRLTDGLAHTLAVHYIQKGFIAQKSYCRCEGCGVELFERNIKHRDIGIYVFELCNVCDSLSDEEIVERVGRA